MNEQATHVTAQFLANRHRLMSFIEGLLRDAPVSEDVFQEVWLKLAQSLDKGVEIQDQAKWCRKVAKNLILQHWRSQRNSKIVVDSALLEFVDFVDRAFDENASLHDYRPERQQALSDCLKSLPEKSKTLIALKYDQGCTLESIGRKVDRSTDSVIKALLRLRQALAICVQKKLKLQELGL